MWKSLFDYVVVLQPETLFKRDYDTGVFVNFAKKLLYSCLA